MEEITKILAKIGLTGSEIKVYLALLNLGSSKKSEVIKESKITPSKIYQVIDKLSDKGLISAVIKNGVTYFAAANPSRVKDYMSQKREEIINEEKQLDRILPKLAALYDNKKSNTKVEVYIGWRGIETVYSSFLKNARKGNEVYVLGAGAGPKEDKFELFFTKYGREAFNKQIKIKVIFNENSREYVEKIERNIKKVYDKKFLFKNTPSEIVIYKENIGILIRKSEPVIIVIQDKETADSFTNYFNELWKIAKR